MGRKIILIILMVVGFVLGTAGASMALDESAYNNSGLSIPRFVSLKSDKVFVRTGPALRYPIKWVFIKEGLPVEIVQEFDTWRKIRDLDGEEGWVHQSLISGTRNALVIREKGGVLVRKPTFEARVLAMLEPKVIVSLGQCSGAWCAVEARDYKGWMTRKSLWGVYQDEELD